MSKHTPGPWKRTDTENQSTWKHNQKIGPVTVSFDRTDEGEYHARLIAEAPEMEELLRAIYSGGGGIDTWKSKVLSLFSRIDAAL
jgi:hypothetical protein